MPTPPPKSPKKPPAGPPRRPSIDGFQAAPVHRGFEAQVASLDRSKAMAGIGHRLTSWAEIPSDLKDELEFLTKTPAMSAAEWLLIQRLVLADHAPETEADQKAESRRLTQELEGPLAQLASSFHLRKLREAGVQPCDLFRGADVLLVGGSDYFEVLDDLGATPSSSPFSDGRSVTVRDFGVLSFAMNGEYDVVVRFEAQLARLRKLAPRLMAFFQQHFVGDQNIGPLGCSPRTLRAGSAVRVMI